MVKLVDRRRRRVPRRLVEAATARVRSSACRPALLLGSSAASSCSIAIRVVGVLLVLAFADFAWQRHKLDKQLRMTKEEVKQESRQADLAPEVRGAAPAAGSYQARAASG